MIAVAYLRENPEDVIERLKIKHFDASAIVKEALEQDARRREMQKNLDNRLAESNRISKEIGNLYKQGQREEADKMKARIAELKTESENLREGMQQAEEALHNLLVQLPNLPCSVVPQGRTAEDNVEVRKSGIRKELHSEAQPHWELAKKYDLIDFEVGTKITGAGFPVYKGKGARLQRALINYFLSKAQEAGYTEYEPPIMVNEATAYATGQLPDKEGQMYYVEKDDFYLIPTAEVPLTNLYRDEILNENDLPLKLTGYTPCFRREAGSYGKDVRGLNRLHQFDKVEIVRIEKPENSYQVLEEMVDYVASLVDSLGLEYRVIRLCGGDMSFASALTYDFEVWSAAQGRWLEISSVSNFETFQSNRLKLRYRDSDGRTQLLHTLNGSALALPRIVAALLENNQTPEGIIIPEVLRQYTGFDRIS